MKQSTFAEGANLSLGEGSTLTLSGLSGSKKTTITLDSTDTWNGIIDNGAYSTLTINNAGKNQTGVLKQTVANSQTLVTGSNFALNNAADEISEGSFKVGNATEDSKANIAISAGTISEGATVNLTKYSSFDITGGSVSLNTGDTWTGNINLNGGTLNYSNLTTHGKLVATTGILNIASGTLTLKAEDSIAEAVDFALNGGGKVVLNQGSLAIDSTDTWAGTIQNAGSVLTVNG